MGQLQAQSYPQRLYTVDDGLPQSIVTDISKDSYGFIWIATNEGLSRFDGHKFKNYNQSTGFPFHLIVGIVEKVPGELWVADNASGLWQLKNDKAQNIDFDPGLKNFHINFLKKTKDGTILLGAEPGGLYVFKSDTILKINKENTGISEPVISADMAKNGDLWIGSYTQGADLVHEGKVVRRITEKDGLPANEVRAILARGNGQVWIGTRAGLYVLGKPSISNRFNKIYPKSQIDNIYASDRNEVYVNIINLQGGIARFYDDTFDEIIDENRSYYSKCMLIEPSGTMLVGTYNGLLVIVSRNFKNFTQSSGLKDTYIKAITKDPKGRLWVGTKNGGVYYRDNHRFVSFKIPEFEEQYKTPLVLHFFGNQFWIGTRNGLLIINKNKMVHNAVSHALDSIEIRAINEMDGDIYVVSRRKLFRIHDGQLIDITYNLSTIHVSLWGMEKDSSGRLWAATNGKGLWTLSDTLWRPYQSEYAPRNVYGIRKDADRHLFFPTAGGAYEWDGKYLKKVFTKAGNVWDILPLNEKDMWLGTSKGLIHLYNNQIDVFTRKIGFASTEFNIGSFYRDRYDTLWFGGVSGIVSYQARKKLRKEKRPLIITSIQAGDSLLFFPYPDVIGLASNENNVSFNYSLISYRQAIPFRYRYFLEGFDSDTSKMTTKVNADYTNLGPGEYTFHVIAYNILDKPISTESTVTFTIATPWWLAWYAWLIYILITVFLIYLIVRWRERILRKRNLMLEKLINERTSDLQASNARLAKEIKDRLQAQEELHKEKDQLAITLAAVTDGVIRVGTNRQVILMNKVAKTLTGFGSATDSTIFIDDVFNIIDEKTFNPVKLSLKEMFQDESQSIISATAILVNLSDHSEKMIAYSIAPIFDRDRQLTGYIFVFRDISLEKKMEEETVKAQKLESIGLLAGGLAHDFNNILSGILGNAQLARLVHKKGQSIDKYLNGIESATQAATNLTHQLLTFAKGGEPVKKVFNINDQLIESVHFSLRGSNVKSAFFSDDDIWPVSADPGQINQVINNLTINADQAMPNGGIFKIQTKNEIIKENNKNLKLAAGKYVKIIFTDQGVGIPKENLSKIFDPYFTTKHKGSGLGLASCYSIMEKHGGTITVQSTLGKGTTFTVYLPAYDGTLEESYEAEPELKEGQGKILVMDDEPYILDLMANFLHVLGYEPELVKDGKEAVTLYKKSLESGNKYAAVITDLTVPGGMGGKEVIRELLKLDSEVIGIVASGYSTDSVLANFQEYGFKGILQKPFKLEQVSQILHHVLSS